LAFEWDIAKAESNFKKHGVRFPEAEPLFEDDDAITITDGDSEPGGQRFVSIGMGAKERLLVAVYCYGGENVRVISVRPAEAQECLHYEEKR
jgi:uncharacterized DUF497 family protein